MKKQFITLIITALTFVFFSNSSLAQSTVKLGHINSQELLTSMPEYDSAQANLQSEMKQMEDLLEDMEVEFNRKYENYVTNQATFSALVRQTKEQELGALQQKIQEFQMVAEQELGAMQQTLFQPVQEKAKKAIEDVALENGFTYIFDSGIGVLVYTSDDSEDILPLVKAKLGLE
jgi:outer membrane protein